MTRVLLVTEGPSDEPVAKRIVLNTLAGASVDRKHFVARGFDVVRRDLELWVRAAYFSHYDLLVIHFDLDDSIPGNFERLSESERWRNMHAAARNILQALPEIGRREKLRVVLMAPCQATEAWLAWGLENEDGTKWERAQRHALKSKLFGAPPVGTVQKAEKFVEKLISQMAGNELWPRSLRSFVDALGAAV